MNDSFSSYPAVEILLACEKFEKSRREFIDSKKEMMISKLIGSRRFDRLWLVKYDRDSAIDFLGGDPRNDYNTVEFIWWRQAQSVSNLKLLAETTHDKIFVTAADIEVIGKYLT